MSTLSQYNPDYATPPGATIATKIKEMGISKKELALRLSLSEQEINSLLKGKSPLNAQKAMGLERITKVPTEFWLRREAIYQTRIRQLKELETLENDFDVIKNNIPLNILKQRGIIDNVTLNTQEKKFIAREQVLQFFGVQNTDSILRLYEEKYAPKMAARQTKENGTWGSIITWLRMAEISASKNVPAHPFNRDRLKNIALDQLKALTTCSKDIGSEIKQCLSNCGVVFVLVPEIPRLNWKGATWWHNETPIIAMNIRGKREDSFWFSLFHEIHHVLHPTKNKIQVESPESNNERDADNFAARTLIPASYNPKIQAAPSKKSLQIIADELGISLGIVAGRFGHLTGNYGRFGKCICSLQWK